MYDMRASYRSVFSHQPLLLGHILRSVDFEDAVAPTVTVVDDGRTTGFLVDEQEEVVTDQLHLVQGLVNGVDGDVIYNVKPGTKTDTKVRLKGKGVPSLRNPQARGDHYVTLEIQTPERLSSEAKEALRRFDELTGNTLHEHDETTGKVEKKKKKGFMEKMKEMKEALED